MKKRPELKIIISSATLEGETFLNYFDNVEGEQKKQSTIISVEGRQYPGNAPFYLTLVNLQYLKDPCENYVLSTIDTINKIHQYVLF